MKSAQLSLGSTIFRGVATACLCATLARSLAGGVNEKVVMCLGGILGATLFVIFEIRRRDERRKLIRDYKELELTDFKDDE